MEKKSFRKIELHSKVRWGIIILTLILFLVSLTAAIWYYTQPITREISKPVFSYKQNINVDYEVFLKPNNFFQYEKLGPNMAYIVPITDYIKTYLSYNFIGTDSVEFNGSYEVVQSCTAYMIEKEFGSDEVKKTKVWQFDEVLVPVTNFSQNGKEINISHEVPIDIIKQFDFLNKMKEELRFSPDLVELTVQYKVNINAKTKYGDIEDAVVANMVIPIGGSVFEVSGVLADQKEDAITVTEAISAEDVLKYRKVFAVAAVIIFILLILFVFVTKSKLKTSFEREMEKIIKKYGNRIVSIQEEIGGFNTKKITIRLETFEDLVKVSDDLIKPIIYKVNGQKCVFCVIDGEILYTYAFTAETEE